MDPPPPVSLSARIPGASLSLSRITVPRRDFRNGQLDVNDAEDDDPGGNLWRHYREPECPEPSDDTLYTLEQRTVYWPDKTKVDGNRPSLCPVRSISPIL